MSTNSNEEYLLEVKDLHTSFFTESGEVKAVNGVSFTLKPGEVMGIVGESGSGKSVTAYSIMQILADTGRIVGGQVLYRGQDLAQFDRKQMAGFRGKMLQYHFPGSDDEPESGIYCRQSDHGGDPPAYEENKGGGKGTGSRDA